MRSNLLQFLPYGAHIIQHGITCELQTSYDPNTGMLSYMFEDKERCMNLNDLTFIPSANLDQALLCDVEIITKTGLDSSSFKLAVINY